MKRIVPVAASAGASPAEQLTIAQLRVTDEREGSDLGLALLDVLAYVGDVLSYYQDRVANEAYLETEWSEGEDRLRIKVPGAWRPACLVIADSHRVYLVTLGPEADEARVEFGEGVEGERPPSGSGKLTAAYRRGTRNVAELELRGLGFHQPFGVIVVGDPGTGRRCLHVWSSEASRA